MEQIPGGSARDDALRVAVARLATLQLSVRRTPASAQLSATQSRAAAAFAHRLDALLARLETFADERG